MHIASTILSCAYYGILKYFYFFYFYTSTGTGVLEVLIGIGITVANSST